MSSKTDPMIGRKIQDFRIESILGSGGMGKVYLAKHPFIGKEIAVKVLNANYAKDKEALARFFREAKVVNEIRHENVVDVINFIHNVDEGECFILMELLQGRVLSDVIATEGPLSTKRVIHIGLQLCAALQAAHEKGIIHRDLKSDNIFLLSRAGQADFVKLLDFGLAKLYDTPNSPTLEGVSLGTPTYMPPEQALGDPADARSDIYSLGVILYEMATKTLPFTAPNFRDVMRKQITAPLPPPRERFASIDRRLEAVIIRCLPKEREDRYQSMVEVAQDLAWVSGVDPTPYFGQNLVTVRPRRSSGPVSLSGVSISPDSLVVPRPKTSLLWYGVGLSLVGALAALSLWFFFSAEPVSAEPQPASKALPQAPQASTEPASAPKGAPASTASAPAPKAKPAKKTTPPKTKDFSAKSNDIMPVDFGEPPKKQ